jgi:serine/threonine protein kinase
MESRSAIAPGQTLLHYRIVRLLGAGGMGAVYEAEDTRLGRPVAVKLLHPGDVDDPDARERFLREARAVAAIEHRNLSTVHAIEETADGTLLLVMALYRGQTLFDMLRLGPLAADRILAIGSQIAAGLHEAHMAGVLHRDIKPANIFIVTNGDVKILDFGLARLAHQRQLTMPNRVVGTLAYMSPEQLSGGAIDHRSDLWALGVVLYEMAASHPPFHHPSQATVMNLICRGEYAPLHRLRPDLPPQVHHAIDGALRTAAHERHASAGEIAQLLAPGAISASMMVDALNPFAADVTTATDATATMALPRQAVQPSPRPWQTSSHSAQNSSEHATRIAVLPLENLSSDPENEYFSDGLTDELISALGLVPGLSVVSRSSAFSFKGKGKNLKEIGESLQVEAVLEGSVRKAAAKVRVSVQLSNAQTGFQIWAARFDREMNDVFELQDELASATVQAIREKLARPVAMPHESSPARLPNADAYDAYLKGRFCWNRKTIEGVQLAGRYFEEALRLDKSFADAHAGMADYYSVLGSLGVMAPHEAWPQARASAMHAVALDPNLPEAHLALASVLQFYDWNWSEGKTEIEKALKLRPERGESYVPYVYHLMTQGHLKQALSQTQRGLKYDPLSISLLTAQALLQTYLGEHETSILLARETLKAAPHYELYYALGLACHAAGRPGEAVEALQQGVEQSRMPLLLGWLAEAHVKNGSVAEAQAAMAELMGHAEKGRPSPVSIAVAATALGDHDLAFTWLERAADARDILVGYLKVMPSLAALRGDERYHRLEKRMKLHVEKGVSV